MTIDELKARLEDSLPGKLTEFKTGVRRLFATVAAADLAEAARAVREALGFTHLSTITGRDTGAAIELLYHFARPGAVLTLRTQVDRARPAAPTVTPLFPGAVLYEREAHDLLGVQFAGHPDLRRLVLPDDWPEGVYPLRKDWQYNHETKVIA